MRILVTGGTGLLGNALGRRLSRSHQLMVLSRQGKNARGQISYPCEVIPWDAKSDLSRKALEGVDGLIHLAGENIAQGRWTPERKKALRDSRVEPLEWIAKALQANGRQLKVAVSASGVGFYGDRGEEELTENSAAGAGFIPDLVKEWEAAALGLQARRTVMLRFGVVLSSEGGFVSEVLKMFRRFGAAQLGSGRQRVSWIHVDDVTEIVSQALLNPSFSGPINCVAPQSVSNADLTKKLATLAGSFRLPAGAPAFALKMMYGEMSELLLSSQNVKPDKLLKLKWVFKIGDIDRALSASVQATPK
jgi:uncharacterized protein (TIGR01777 family)